MEEEIDIMEIVKYLLKKKGLIIKFMIIAVIVGAIINILTVPQKFTAKSTILFSRVEGYEAGEAESQLLSELNFNNKVLGTYKSYMCSDEVIGEVITNLGLEDSLEDFKDKISISTGNSSITVKANDSEQIMSENIANELVNVFLQKAKDFYHINHSYTINPANENTTKANVGLESRFIFVFVSAIVGAVIAIGITGAKYIFDPVILSDKEIRNKFKIPFLANILVKTNSKEEIIEEIEESSQFDILRANIEFSKNDEINNKTIFITNASPKSGNSFISANLAISFSKIGKKVLVIDVDKNNGLVHKVLKLENKYGIYDYINDNNVKDVKYLIQETKYKFLDIISIGNLNDNNTGSIQNDKLKNLIQQVKEVYDIIIVNGMEFLKYADSRFLANCCDETILVVKKAVTKENELIESVKEIKKVNGSLHGVVLSKTE